jgi:hypothetical protein
MYGAQTRLAILGLEHLKALGAKNCTHLGSKELIVINN